MHEISTLPALEEALATGGSLRGLRLQDLDLSGHEAELLARNDVEGLVVLGGRLSTELAHHLRTHGALVFPTDPRAPVDPYRARLYQPEELYDGLREFGYAATPDARAYRWASDAGVARDAFVTLLRAIHDDSITDALTERLDGAATVGVMGGHAVDRGTPGYRRAADLGQALAAAGYLVLTGGGPGAMEAANLGALSASVEALEEAVGRLASVPSFDQDVTAWASVALDVRHDVLTVASGDQTPRSIGIPTWFYGHEPPHVFADDIAKYFSNAIREDGLLSRCTAGVVVLDGAAGTVQEVFQLATRLYYAKPEDTPPRLVLVGRRQWTDQLPVWPALHSLAEGRGMADLIHLVDDPAEAVALLGI